MKKDFGGLGVLNMKDLNLCLLRNWIKRYIKDEGKIWRKVIDSKYCISDNILHSDGRQASPFWKGVMLAA
jgi:hypothetical protein